MSEDHEKSTERASLEERQDMAAEERPHHVASKMMRGTVFAFDWLLACKRPATRQANHLIFLP